MTQEGYIYILKSPNNKRYYIGSTINPYNRLAEHNNGEVIATHNKGLWTICLLQKYDNITTARRVESKIKKLKSRIILEKMINDGYIKINI